MSCNVSDSTKKVSLVNVNEDKPKVLNVYEVRAIKCDGVCKPIAASAKAVKETVL